MKIDEMRIGKPTSAPRGPRAQMRREDAELIAISALSHIAADDERLQKFLAVTGLDPSNLRSEAADPSFASGILDYVCNDEALLVGFAEAQGAPPERIVMAQQFLAGPRGENW